MIYPPRNLYGYADHYSFGIEGFTMSGGSEGSLRRSISEASDNEVLAATAVLARHLIDNEGEILNLSQAERDQMLRSIDQARDDIARKHNQLSEDDLQILGAECRKLLIEMAQSNKTIGLVETAWDISKSQIETFGTGSEIAKAAMGIGLAVSLIILSSKFHADWGLAEGNIGFDRGLPEGLAEIVETIGTTVDSLADKVSDTASSGSLIPVGASRYPVGFMKNGLSRHDALDLRNELWKRAQEAPLPYSNEAIDSEIFHRGKSGPEAEHWVDDRTYRVDVGIFGLPIINDRSKLAYRISVRIQTPRRLKKKYFREIENYFDEVCDGLAKVREIGEVRSLNRFPTDKFMGAWRGPTTAQIGGQISAFDGTVGAITLFVKREGDDRLFALTAGHVGSDEGTRQVSEPIYCPATGDGPPPDPEAVLGRLYDFKMPTLSPFEIKAGRLGSLGDSMDAALVEVTTNGQIDRCFVKDICTLSGVIDPIETLGPERSVVFKAPACTAKRGGWVSSEETIVTVTMSDYSVRTVVGALEIAGQASMPFAEYGDSGALVVDRDDRGCGMVFAGTRRGKISDEGTGATYMLRLPPILDTWHAEFVGRP